MIEPLYPTVGMIIPTYFSSRTTDAKVRELFAMTLHQVDYYVSPENVRVVIDGDPRSHHIIRDLCASLTGAPFGLTVLPRNLGKLGAIRAGMAELCARCPGIDRVIVRDCDGDHSLEAIPLFMRLADEMAYEADREQLLIIGARTSRHHPMGWIRGELETILDAVTLDALAFALARQNRVPDLRYCSAHRALPDISSGYKLYSRSLVESVFLEKPLTASLSQEDYDHLAPETGPFVEAMLQGALVGEVERATFNGQPTTSFGEFEHAHLYGRLLAWVWTRLAIPALAGVVMFDNHAAKSLLQTSASGVQALDQVRELAAQLAQDSSDTPDSLRKRRRRSFV